MNELLSMYMHNGRVRHQTFSLGTSAVQKKIVIIIYDFTHAKQ